MNKIITYIPQEIIKTQSIPKYFNSELEKAYKNDKIDNLIFIQKDIQDNIIDFNKFIESYNQLMLEYDLPYSFYPYYIYFNRLLPNVLNKPNPKLNITIKKVKNIQVVCVPAYGFLMLNVKKLKSINFKFDENLTELYWLQDMIQKCYEQKLWLSNCCFLDVTESWKMLKDYRNINGFYINGETYKKEKENYEKLQIKYHSIQEFLDIFKGKFNI